MMPNTQLKLIFSILTTLILSGVLVFVLYSIKAKNVEIQDLQSLADQYEESGQLAQSSKNLRNNFSEDLDSLENFAIAGDRLVPLIERIERAGRGLSLETKILSVEESSDGEIKKIKMRIEAVGEWAGVFTYLQGLENLPHQQTMEEVSLSKESGEWRLTAVLVLHAID
jgi:Tfp pilus assembly protein PilO